MPPKTIVEIDLVGYSTICDHLEQGLDVRTVAQLNKQIQSFIDAGLSAAGVLRDQAVAKTTGDGAILIFDSARLAHQCVAAVHAATAEHNRTRTQPLAKRVFRSGAATGEIAFERRRGGGFEIAGTTIARAVRLEARASPGGILVDDATFESLSDEQKRCYGAKTRVAGKRDEKFEAFPCVFIELAATDTAHFTNPKEERPAAIGGPQLMARFREENGEPCPLSNGKCPAYWMDLWVHGAPRSTKSVSFEILDEGFEDAQWTVKRPKGSTVRDFLTGDMNSYGDVEIWARGTGRADGSWLTRSSLYEALVRYYGKGPRNEKLRKALKQIRDE